MSSHITFRIDPRWKPISLILTLLATQLICSVSALTVYTSALVSWDGEAVGLVILDVFLAATSVAFVLSCFSLYLFSRLAPRPFLGVTFVFLVLWVVNVVYSTARLRLRDGRGCLVVGPDREELNGAIAETEMHRGKYRCIVYWGVAFGAGGAIIVSYLITSIYILLILRKSRRRDSKKIYSTVILDLPPPGTPPVNVPRPQIRRSAGQQQRTSCVRNSLVVPKVEVTPATPSPRHSTHPDTQNAQSAQQMPAQHQHQYQQQQQVYQYHPQNEHHELHQQGNQSYTDQRQWPGTPTQAQTNAAAIPDMWSIFSTLQQNQRHEQHQGGNIAHHSAPSLLHSHQITSRLSNNQIHPSQAQLQQNETLQNHPYQSQQFIPPPEWEVTPHSHHHQHASEAQSPEIPPRSPLRPLLSPTGPLRRISSAPAFSGPSQSPPPQLRLNEVEPTNSLVLGNHDLGVYEGMCTPPWGGQLQIQIPNRHNVTTSCQGQTATSPSMPKRGSGLREVVYPPEEEGRERQQVGGEDIRNRKEGVTDAIQSLRPTPIPPMDSQTCSTQDRKEETSSSRSQACREQKYFCNHPDHWNLRIPAFSPPPITDHPALRARTPNSNSISGPVPLRPTTVQMLLGEGLGEHRVYRAESKRRGSAPSTSPGIQAPSRSTQPQPPPPDLLTNHIREQSGTHPHTHTHSKSLPAFPLPVLPRLLTAKPLPQLPTPATKKPANGHVSILLTTDEYGSPTWVVPGQQGEKEGKKGKGKEVRFSGIGWLGVGDRGGKGKRDSGNEDRERKGKARE